MAAGGLPRGLRGGSTATALVLNRAFALTPSTWVNKRGIVLSTAALFAEGIGSPLSPQKTFVERPSLALDNGPAQGYPAAPHLHCPRGGAAAPALRRRLRYPLICS